MARSVSKTLKKPKIGVSSAAVSRASDEEIRKSASTASYVLRDPNASCASKSVAGSSMSQYNEIKKGGAAYYVKGIEGEGTVVSTATSVHTVKAGANKFRRALSNLAKK